MDMNKSAVGMDETTTTVEAGTKVVVPRAMVMEVLKFSRRRNQFERVELENKKAGFYGIIQAGISIHRELTKLEEGNTIVKVSTLEGEKNPFPTDKFENSFAMGLAIMEGYANPETVVYKVMYRLPQVVTDEMVKDAIAPKSKVMDLI